MSRSERSLFVALVGVACSLVVGTSDAVAGLATFDSFNEGFQGGELTDGGISFFDADARLFADPPNSFAIDLAFDSFAQGGIFEDSASFFSSPNVLAMEVFSAGTRAALGRFGEFWMTTGRLESFASIEVFHLDTLSTIGNRIVLEGYLDGLLVDSDILQLTQSGVSHDTLSISGTTFDELRFGGFGPMEDGIFVGFVDNVVITPEPGSLWLLLLSSCCLLRCPSSVRRSHSAKSRIVATLFSLLILSTLPLARAGAQSCTSGCNGLCSTTSMGPSHELFNNLPQCGGTPPFNEHDHIFDGLCYAASPVTVTVTVAADLGGSTKFLDVFQNGLFRQSLFVGTGTSACSFNPAYSQDSLTLTVEQFNAAIDADPENKIRIRLEPSCAVQKLCEHCCQSGDPFSQSTVSGGGACCGSGCFVCAPVSWSTVRLDYTMDRCCNDAQCDDGNPATSDSCVGENCCNVASPGGVLRVDSNADTGGNGTSWLLAYKYLKDALYNACSPGQEVWVAAGTYNADDSETAGFDGLKNQPFRLRTGIAMYGGFNGTELVRDDRDFAHNPTILSGDIGTLGDDSDNSWHVVTADDTDDNTVLDGFIITKGRAYSDSVPHNNKDMRGAGMRIDRGSPVVRNCQFIDNRAENVFHKAS